MEEITKGTKLIKHNKYFNYDISVDFVKTVNEKSYSLEKGWKIDKETMMNKWGELYTIPTKKQLKFLDKKNKKEVLTKITRDFNSELRETISILETLNNNSNLLELNKGSLENIEYCIENLSKELESDK